MKLKPITCHHCDFGSGQRGMDRCSKCGGTGSGFWANGSFYPNTKEGHDAAVHEIQNNPKG